MGDDMGESMESFLNVVLSGFRKFFGFAISLIRSLEEFGTRQFIAGLIFCLFCAWWNCLSQIYVDKMHWAHFKAGDSRTLPDIGFILLPYIPLTHLPDAWNALIVCGTLIPVLVFHPAKVKILRRYAAIQGTCFLLRSITIMVTILPNPFKSCVSVSSDTETPALEAFKVMLGLRHTCGDVLYSGHAANFTLMALVWQEYGSSYFPLVLPLRSPCSDTSQDGPSRYTKEWFAGIFFPRFFWAIAVIGYLIIIGCRFHYTVDVLVAIVVVAKQWGLYHMVIRTPQQLAKLPFLAWFEQKEFLFSRETSEQFGFEETPRASSVGDTSRSEFPLVSHKKPLDVRYE